MFQVLYFLQNALKVNDTTAQLLVGAGAAAGLFWFVFFGKLSDRVGRKKPIVIGYAATLLLLFPLFHIIAGAANPGLAEASRREPIRSEEHTSETPVTHAHLVCRLLLEKKKKRKTLQQNKS